MSMRTHPGTDTVSESLGRELNKLLGKYADSELARRIARIVNAAYRKEQKSGLPLVLPGAWTKEEIKLLGTKPDQEIAKLVGRSVKAVRQERLARNIAGPIEPGEAKPWTSEEDKLLGTRSDKEIARLLGRTPGAVETRRLKRKIPLAHPPRKAWTHEEEKLLGTRP